MISFPDKKYNIIYADPPWRYYMYKVRPNMPHSKKPIRMASAFYDTMSTDEICKLPVAKLADDKCVLFMWVTNPLLQDGLRVIEAWGFKYINVGFVWVKTNQGSTDKLKLGLGYYTRPSCELCLFAKKGTGMRPINRSVYQVQYSEVTRHSEKPNLFRNQIVKLFGDLPRIELFSRHIVKAWDNWGNDSVLTDTNTQDLDHYMSLTSVS